ncbi:MAG: DUF839 domain-containing protein [Acidimicrobiales bacterium]|nr:DUF839 domain-containing protein [Acidimicrobiales bacterium]
MRRRDFLRTTGGIGAALGLGGAFWRQALAAPAQPGPSPYGDLGPPDANGLRLPPGFTSRVVAASLTPVAGTTHVWHPFPDGGACLPTDDGGWIYVSNCENPPPVDVPGLTGVLATLVAQVELAGVDLASLPTGGGVGAIRFDASGAVVGAYLILSGSLSNCAGGLTPWDTWLSCEEWEDEGGYTAGRVFECDPFGVEPAVVRPALGLFKHEAAACDPVGEQVYLTEDQTDGLFYRYTPPPGTWGSGAALEGGTLEAMQVSGDGTVTWLRVADVMDPAAPTAPLRSALVGATPFNGGEGAIYDDGSIYITTKGDDRVWVHDIAAQTMAVLYAASDTMSPVLTGVDNIAVSAAHDLYVAEDGGNLQVCVITQDRVVAPIVEMTGVQHGFDTGTPLPLMSEVTGLALSPDGNRLYFNSERGFGIGGLPLGPGPGVLYEVTGPFRGGTLAAAAAAPPVTAAPATAPPAPVGGDVPIDELPATGGADGLRTTAAAAALAGAALWRLRQRTRAGGPAD